MADAGEYDALESGIELDGYKAKIVYGTSNTFDKKKLVGLGINLEEVTISKPKKPYVKVSVPGRGRKHDDE
jgi:hypothetical protein